MRRTPSPQQAFDSVKKFGAAGIAAAGAAMGGALSAIREESTESRSRGVDRRTEEGFSDHERWSEEAEKRVASHADQSRDVVSTNVAGFGESTGAVPKQYTGGRRKMVAIVVSSETLLGDLQEDDGKYHSEHAVRDRMHLCIHRRLTSILVVTISSAASQSFDDIATDPHLQPSSVNR
jgi:hypothetical protein